jgi:hypothetical protein
MMVDDKKVPSYGSGGFQKKSITFLGATNITEREVSRENVESLQPYDRKRIKSFSRTHKHSSTYSGVLVFIEKS